MQKKQGLSLGAFLISATLVLTLGLAACGTSPTNTPAPVATTAAATTAASTGQKVNSKQLDELKGLNKYVTNFVGFLEKNDLEKARQDFKEFLEGWEEQEDFVKPAVLYGYRDVEQSISKISPVIFSTEKPASPAALLPDAKELQRKYNEVVTAMEKAVTVTPTVKA